MPFTLLAAAASTFRLATADWAVLLGYLALLVGVAFLLARKRVGTQQEYFLASRSMPTWAVAVSILATAQSAATFLGAPEQGASGDLRYLLANLGVIVAAIVVATVFLPAYFRYNVQTPYELLERAAGPATRRMASASYLLGRLLASAARVYIGSIPFCLAFFGEVSAPGLLTCVLGFMAFGAVFTLASGARGAIWSDVVQVGVYLGAAIVIALALIAAIPPGEASIITRALAGKDGTGVTLLGPLSDSWNFAREFTPLTAITGIALLNLAFFAMDQDLTQRLLACKSAAHAARSLLINALAITLPVVVGFVLLGLLLALYFREVAVVPLGPDGKPITSGDPRLIIQFAFLHSPAGVAGLLLAGVLAAGPAGINSSLNAMAGSFIADLYRPLRPARDEGHYLRAGRLATVIIGLLMALVAVICIYWHAGSQRSIISFALGIMVYAYAGLIGVFFAAIIFRRLHPIAPLIAMPAGLLIVVLFTVLESQKIISIAWPWHLVGGSLVSLAIASLGAKRRPDADA